MKLIPQKFDLPVWFSLSLVGALVFGVMTAGILWWSSPGSPVRFRGVTVSTPTVGPAGEVELIFAVDRARACPALIMGFWIEPATGRAAVRLPLTSGGYGAIGANVNTGVSIVAPSAPGRYCYRATLLHICGDDTYTERTPDACVDVVLP